MTPRQNINNLFAQKKAPYIGLYDQPWGDTIAAWVEQGYPTRKITRKVEENGRETEKEFDAPLSAAEVFGYDMVKCGGWFNSLPLKDVNEVVEETDAWVVRRNGAGAALKFWKNKSGTPAHIDFRMNSREVWQRDYRPHLVEFDPTRMDVERARQQIEQVQNRGDWAFVSDLFVWEKMRQAVGDFTLYESVLLNPGWVHDYSRVYTDFYKAHFKRLFEQGVVPDAIRLCEDLAYRDRLFCSPKLFEELLFPYYREMVEFFHSYGIPVMMHSDGYVDEVLELIVEAGFDALNPMEVKAGCDVVRYAQRYGDKLVFVGGCDARIFETNDRDVIQREVTALMNKMKSIGARWVFGSDHSISTRTRYDTYRYVIELYRELREY